MEFSEIGPAHEDFIHDITFDYYGKRFATCSSDKHIKIWTLDETKNGTWSHVDISRAHSDSIWRLSWANPEFGQLIASCSEDSTICIWEEQESASNSQLSENNNSNSSSTRWVKKIKLSNSKRSVNDVAFSNRSLGIKLAAASADGYLRMYEAPDVFDLNKWDLMLECQVEDIEAEGNEHGLTCLAWNDCPFEPAKIAVGGYSKRAIVYAVERNILREECVLGQHDSPIHDIAWAPSMGRSYHLIATATRERTFKIHTLKRRPDGSVEYVSTETMATANNSKVGRVAWNATGTVLATSSEDGSLSLWRKTYAGSWINVQDIPSNLDSKLQYFYKNP